MNNLFSRTGLAILALITVMGIWLMSGFKWSRVDLTEDSLYTLSKGTANMMSRLEEPVHLKLFYSKKAAQGEPYLKNYATRVIELLEEYQALSGGRLTFEIMDPEPFSETEDDAARYGLQGVEIKHGEKFYLGLVAQGDIKTQGPNAEPRTESIPFFHPDKERFLEYDISNVIYSVSRSSKPKVGVLSGIELSGGFDMSTQQISSGWVSVSQLEKFYQVDNLDSETDEIPEDIGVLVVIFPEDLPKQTLYAIDQFVMHGGHMLVFLDPLAEAASQSNNVITGSTSEIKSAYMKELLASWGVEVVQNKFVADNKFALSVNLGGGQTTLHLGALGVTEAGLNTNDIVTANLNSINFSSAGAIRQTEGATTKLEPLIQSSNQSSLMDINKIYNLTDPRMLYRDFKPTGEQYMLAARMTGDVTTAFPNGVPAKAEDDNKKTAAKHKPVKKQNHLSSSSKPANIVIIADTDVLSNRLWVQINQFFGQQLLTPFANNGDFLINVVGNLQGDADVISIRGRGQYARPFTKVVELEKDAQSRFLQKEEELTARLKETERKLSALQQQKTEGQDVMVLTPEQQQEVEKFQNQKLKIRKELREVKHQLNNDIEKLGVALKIINILLMPILLTIVVFSFRRYKRRQAAAI